MERLEITASLREKTGKGPARRARMQGFVPAVLYGQGSEAVNLTVDPKALGKTIAEAGGLNVLFNLKIEGRDTIPVMVKDYQAHVLSRHFLHVDFLKVDLTKKISVQVPIHLVGKAPGVKEGGILEHITRSIKVVCLPTAIPEALEVDVSALDIGDNLHIHDLKQLPQGVEIPAGVDFTIAAVVAPVEEKELAPATEVVQPEVIGEKKPEEGAAAAPAPGGKAPAAGKEEKKEKK